jgi:hypothetical protein
LLLCVLYLSYNVKEDELGQQLQIKAKEYTKIHNAEAFAESLQYKKPKGENCTEGIMACINILYLYYI